MIHFLDNDGTENLTDVTVEANLDIPGAWMGLSSGDFNADGNLDIFGSNFGDYAIANPVLAVLNNMNASNLTENSFTTL